MEYQLVLQWPSINFEDYDEIIQFEEVLYGILQPDNHVDGHDIGSGEVNIFILTNDPINAFSDLVDTIKSYGLWDTIRVAYRETDNDSFTILWPRELKVFNVI